MRKQFEKSVEIGRRDTNMVELHLCKLFEETGELAQAVNKVIGRKTRKKNDTAKSIRDNIKEEIVDSIQCLFIIGALNAINYDELKDSLDEKNQVYANSFNKGKGKGSSKK
jgi:NTP pyrophosphatase (non-canonical NTP hydrolase)